MRDRPKRGTGPRGPDGRFARKPNKATSTPEKSQSDEDLDSSPGPPTTKRAGTIGRGKSRLTRDRTASTSSEKTPGQQNSSEMGPLTINTDQMSDSDIDQTIKDSPQSGQKIQIRDSSGKVTFYNNIKTEIELELSELELASNLCSSTEIEKDIEQLENANLRRSKRSTKTNPIVRLNNPVNQSDYRKHSKTTQPVTTSGVHGRNAGTGQGGRPVNRP